MKATRIVTTLAYSALGMACVLVIDRSAIGSSFTVGINDPSASWNAVYAQGFSPSVSPNPDPGLAAGTTVYLNQFQFFKSGNPDNNSNIQLAVLNNIFGDLTNLSTSSPLFVGLSTNTIAGTSGIATNNPITFNFNSLPLTYGNNYAAVYVNVGAGGTLTPVLVPSLLVHYVESPPGSGSFHPAVNYGTESQFTYATSNFTTTNQFGRFFNTFDFAGDANFSATIDTVPEPSSLFLLGCGALIAALGHRHRSASNRARR